MKIGIGNDHVAVEYKKEIKKYIEEKYGYEVVNYGTDSTERFNYPVSGEAVANAVVSGEVDKGIVICGTGVGISLAANKVNGIRCVTCSEPYSALLSRQHNNTNMLAFGARVVGIELAKMIVDAWLSGEYEGGRHQVRIDMLKEIEEKQKNKFRKEDLNYPAEILCRYFFFEKFFLPPKFKHIKNRAKEILKKGAPANGRYERYGRFGKTKRKRVR